MGGVLKIVLSANKSNPITRGINNSIEGWIILEALYICLIDLIRFLFYFFRIKIK